MRKLWKWHWFLAVINWPEIKGKAENVQNLRNTLGIREYVYALNVCESEKIYIWNWNLLNGFMPRWFFSILSSMLFWNIYQQLLSWMIIYLENYWQSMIHLMTRLCKNRSNSSTVILISPKICNFTLKQEIFLENFKRSNKPAKILFFK